MHGSRDMAKAGPAKTRRKLVVVVMYMCWLKRVLDTVGFFSLQRFL